MSLATALLPSSRTFDYDPDLNQFLLKVSARDRDKAAQIPGLRFHKATETWRGPPLLSVALAARGVFGNELDVTDAAYAAVVPEVEVCETVRAVKNGEQHPAESDPRLEGLKPKQKDAAFLAALRGGFLIGDEKGVGKTVEAAGAINITGDLPILIVCTKSMQYTWAEEIEKWCKLRVSVVGRTPKQRLTSIKRVADGEADVLVICWEQLRIHSRLAPFGSVARTDAEKADKELNEIPWQTVIADEAHKAKTPSAKQTRALWAVAHEECVKNRWALTATPITGNTLDLWSVLHFISPQDWPSRSKFRDRYCLVYVNHWGAEEDRGLNPHTEPEFRSIFEPRYIRRPLEVDVDLLPPQYRYVELEGKQRSIYRQIEKESIARVDDRYMVAVGPLVVNLRLQQIAQGTPVLDADGNVAELTMPSCKVDALFDLMDEMGDDPLVVFSESRLLIELCYRELTKGKSPRLREDQIGMIVGGVSSRNRTDFINRFQAGELPLIMCTIGAGSEGITLTRARTCVFLNRSYRYVGNNQSEGRLYRHGQTRDVQIIDIVAKDTEEYRVHDSSFIKEGRLQEIVQDEDWTPRIGPEA